MMLTNVNDLIEILNLLSFLIAFLVKETKRYIDKMYLWGE